MAAPIAIGAVDALVSNTNNFTVVPVRPRLWVLKAALGLILKWLFCFYIFSFNTNEFSMIGGLTANNMLLQKWVGNREINKRLVHVENFILKKYLDYFIIIFNFYY